MKSLKIVLVGLLGLFILSGCAANQAKFYEAQKFQDTAILQASKATENDKIEFDGKFEGKIKIVQGKKQPRFNQIQAPKSTAELFIDGLKTAGQIGLGVAGYHYNFKTADSSNKYNSENIKSWTGNYQNTSISNTSVTDTNTSITDKNSITDTNTSVTDNTQTIVPVTVDSNGTDIGN